MRKKIKIFFNMFKILKNLFAETYNEQTDQENSLSNIEDVSLHLKVISQLSRTYLIKFDKFIKLNSGKLYLFNVEKLFID